jgi:hypothetical protein
LKDPGPPYWSISYRLARSAESLPEFSPAQQSRLIGAIIFAPFDAIHWVMRVMIWPLFVVLWYCERGVARLLRRTFFCPLCYNPMRDPYVYCPACGRVQGNLEPRINNLLFKRCVGCGEKRWRIFGNYLFKPPQPLVCRDTIWHLGCYRPHHLDKLAGKCSARRIALVGPNVASKHVFLSHLVNYMVEGRRARPKCYRSANHLSTMEFELLTQVLPQDFGKQTKHYERPGKRYTLARTLVLRKGRSKRLAVIHNVPNACMHNEERLFRDGLAWRQIDAMVFVADLSLVAADGWAGLLSLAEVYSRVVRVIEKDLPLAPGKRLPFRVAIVLPLTQKATLARSIDSEGCVPPDEVERYISQETPGFYALVQRTVSPSKLRFFGGLVTSKLNPQRSRWLDDVVRWVARG